jgi:cell division protein FtsB
MAQPPTRWTGPERRTNWPAPPENSWHLDKRIPIAFLLAILMQTATAVWWAADQAGSMHRVRADVLLLQAERREEARANAMLRETLATLKETAIQQQRTLERIERQMEAIMRRAQMLP